MYTDDDGVVHIGPKWTGSKTVCAEQDTDKEVREILNKTKFIDSEGNSAIFYD